MSTQPFLIAEAIWMPVRDANPTALAIFHRHYSYKPRVRSVSKQPFHFVGPGEKMVLLTGDARALFVWRKFRSMDRQQGVNCAVFRNESDQRASDLILAAEVCAWDRWPGERLYTYVNPRKVRRTRTPGRCFIKAGWRYVRNDDGKRRLTVGRKLLILEKIPQGSPIPESTSTSNSGGSK